MSALDAMLRAAVAGRRFVVCAPILQECGPLAREVLEAGASGCLLIGARQGAGAPPDAGLGAQIVLGLPPAALMASIRSAYQAFAQLPELVHARIDAFDPDGSALTLGTFFGDGRPVAGRRVFGGRPAAWQRLEDKTIIDAVWDAAGLSRAPSEVVPVDEAAAAASRIDRGAGTVWAADARDGFHGGATLTYRVQDEAAARRAVSGLAGSADRVRVMPFLEGIPCSIHGIVLPDAVMALRPVEMVVLRRDRGAGFHYMRAATAWDPLPADREAMRRAARDVGAWLRANVGYRGAFTIDGVMTADGFRPTELNPRVGAAMTMVMPEVPVALLHYALIEGASLPLDPAAWEAELLERADRERVVRLGFTFEREVDIWRQFGLRVVGPGPTLEEVSKDDADAVVQGVVGPGPSGGFVDFRCAPPSWRRGESVGSLAAALVAWANDALGAGIGPVSAPTRVR